MFPEFSSLAYEAFSELALCLRALELPDGLTDRGLSTLATIAAHEPISLSSLAETETVSPSTMSRLIAKLKAEGLVERRKHKSGDREILVSITAKGRVVYRRLTQQCLTNLKGTLGALTPEQFAAIHLLLSSLAGPQLSNRASELERLYAIAPVGLCYFDTDLRFLYINEWLARINGLSVEAHLGQTIDSVLPEVAVGVVPQLRVVLQTGEPIIEGEVKTATPAHPGELRHYMHSYYPDKSKDGTIVGVSCVVQDISERT